MSVYGKILYGWQVTTSNQALPFDRAGVNKDATLRLGVYTHADFATEVARAMNAADTGQTYTCAFSTSTDKFTIANGAAFALEFTRSAVDCFGLLGFANADTAAAVSQVSTSAAGAGTSTASSWTLLEPATHTPVTARAAGAAMGRGEREINAVQLRTDGGQVDTIFFSETRHVEISFEALLSTGSPSEISKMESFLDWIVQGRRFTFQPDVTSTDFISLVADNPSRVAPAFAWLARPEVGYGKLRFIEQVSRS